MSIELIEGIDRQKREDKARQEAVNERYDGVIRELEVIDQDWWLNYPTSRSIMATLLTMERAVKDWNEYTRLDRVLLNLKRCTVASYIVPAMNACIRAGFVKPSE